MPIQINVHHLETRTQTLQGYLPVSDLEVELPDDVVQLRKPLRYDLQAERLGDAILLRGRLELEVSCICVRCLRPTTQQVSLVDWACHVPLEGGEKVTPVHDVVDLTPFVREDILLALPQHPLCESECCGVPSAPRAEVPNSGSNHQTRSESSVWSELDKLKF
jgi:uncharacterized metal-binding protein YceD (DUF177 family)